MDFKLPELGEGVQEGELIKWLVKDGDTVSSDQVLLEVMTDKATMEVPSPANGVISKLQGSEGDILEVGQVLAQIGGVSKESGSKKKSSEETPPKKPDENKKETKSSEVPASEINKIESNKPVEVNSEVTSYDQVSFSPVNDNVYASPIVRKQANKKGIDLASVSGTGPVVNGSNRILEKDLLSYLSSQASVGSSQAKTQVNSKIPVTKTLPAINIKDSSENIEVKPVRGLRRVISKSMEQSKFTIPHYSYVDEFECSSLIDVRNQAKKIAAQYGVKISYLPFIVKAVVAALKKFPEVNSTLVKKDKAIELNIKKYFHIGFAVATDQGLLVPVIKHADQKSLLQIAKEMIELSNKARAGKASKDELTGSTFTITSMGNIGGLFATPIINYPEVGILGVYKIQKKPVVKNDQIVVGQTMNLSLSLDHRVIDGAVGGYFCNEIISYLKEPVKILMES